MFYATQVNPNGTKLVFSKESETLEGMKAIITEWRSRVTPRMAETIKFDIRHDSDIETTVEMF